MPTNVRATLIDNIGFKVNIKEFPEFLMDEPPEFHGDNRGPSSAEFLLTAIAGCQGTSFQFCLQKFNIQVEEMVVNVESEMHHVWFEEYERKILITTNVHVSIDVKLKNPDDQENLQECFALFQKFCVVTMSVRRGIPVDVKLNQQQ